MSKVQRRTQRLRPNIAKSPYFPATERAGALIYEPYNNTYWPRDYGRDHADEFQAISERAVLIDVGCERTVELQGPDALRFADYLCTRNLLTIKPDRARHTVVCEPTGDILCEAIVLRLAEDVVWIGHGPVDFVHWTRAIAESTEFDVEIRQTNVFPLAVQGPRAYEIMQELAPEAADLKFFQWVSTTVAGVEAIIVRSGYTGAFGFEIYPFDPERAPRVWDAVVEAGEPHGLMITPMVGPNFERGVTDFRHGDRINLNPFEARLDRAVDLDAGPFIGKEVLRKIAETGPARTMLGVRFRGERDLPVFEDYWPIESASSENVSPGLVTRVIYSYIFGEFIGYAIVDSTVQVDTRVTVRHPNGRVEAELVELPFVD